MKTCAKCSQSLDDSLFNQNKKNRSGLSSYCKACVKKAVTEWQSANPEKRRKNRSKWAKKNSARLNKQRRARFAADPERLRALRAKNARTARLKRRGLTGSSLIEKLEAQGNVCVLCGCTLTAVTAVIDHCHKSGKTRDLLCRECNISLGHLENDDFFIRAIAYTVRHRSRS